MAKKATLDKLNGLHDLIATYYAERVTGGLGEEGEELSSGTLAAVNAFLKNNNITADLIESSPTQDLTQRFQELINERKEVRG